MSVKFKRLWFVSLLPIAFVLNALAHNFPVFTERWYTQGIYRLLLAVYGRVFGYLPFSAAQLLIIALPVSLVIYIVLTVYKMIKQASHRKSRGIMLGINILCIISIMWFMYVILCGINYGRQGFAELAGLDTRPSSVSELAALCENIVKRANDLSDRVMRNDDGQMVLASKNVRELSNKTRAAYKNIESEYPFLGGYTPHAKPVIYSRFMSRLNIMGIYAPHTMEANVNVHVPGHNIPASMAHELAHVKGFMREDEANFIAWLVCHYSGDFDLMYSGEILALKYALNQLRPLSDGDYTRIMDSLHEGIKADLQADRLYWAQFESRAAAISTAVNDSYLRANRQADGVASYGRMVDLLLAYYRGI